MRSILFLLKLLKETKQLNALHFSFPKDPIRRATWLALIPLKGKFYESARICSLHFKPTDRDVDRSGRLSKTANPYYLPKKCDHDPIQVRIFLRFCITYSIGYFVLTFNKEICLKAHKYLLVKEKVVKEIMATSQKNTSLHDTLGAWVHLLFGWFVFDIVYLCNVYQCL